MTYMYLVIEHKSVSCDSTHLTHRRPPAKIISEGPNKRVAMVINQQGRIVLMGIMSVFTVFLMNFSI